MSFIVEAYVAESDRLLWRSRGMDDQAAYDLAIKVDPDPRIEVLLIHVDDHDGTESIVVVDQQEDERSRGPSDLKIRDLETAATNGKPATARPARP